MCSAMWVHPTHGPTKCGQCMECRLAYSREWAIRISHEASMYEHNCFLTLTYADEHLPAHGQLLKRDLQLFFKRLRKQAGPFRYVACGEYGELKRRPHFHVAMFGKDFYADKVAFGEGIRGDQMFISPTIGEVWPFGRHSIGSLTFESAAYIGRYITKKVTGVGASALPLAVCGDTGELVMPNPEFLLMSKGIGKKWFDDFFLTDVFPHGRVITQQGTPAPVPRYYKEKLKELGGDLALRMRHVTESNMDKALPSRIVEDSPSRRAARGIYAKARTGIFKRDVRS